MGDNGAGIPPFAVILVAGLTVFGLVFIAGQELDFTTEEPEEVVLFSGDFGEVGSAHADYRAINFGDFTVGDTRSDVDIFRSRRETVRNTLLTENVLEFEYNATQPEAGQVSFEVMGKDGDGELYIEVNGDRIFQEAMITSAEQDVMVPVESLEHGMNDIVIGATRGGLFSSTEYTLSRVEATVNDRRIHDYRESFQLYDYEMEDFVESELRFSIASSIRTSPLEVYINGNQVYSREQARISPEEVEIDRGVADLAPGYNTISFETDGQAEYVIENVELRIMHLAGVEDRTIREAFSVNPRDLDFAGQDDTLTAVRFDYQRMLPTARPMLIDINGNEYDLTPSSGENELEISAEDLQETDNVVVIQSNTTYQLNNFRIMSQKVE